MNFNVNTLPSDALVVFGATGDLARKQIFPALYAMSKRGALDVPVIGIASSALSREQLRARVKASIDGSGGVDDAPAFERLMSLLQFVSGNYNDARTFETLK